MKTLLFSLLLITPFLSFSQNMYKETKLSLCLDELELVEKEWAEDRVVLLHQEGEILKLKKELADSRYEIQNLKEDVKKTNVVREELFIKALKFDDEGQTAAAKEMFLLIIKLFPKSFEAANSRVRLQEIYINEKKDKKK